MNISPINNITKKALPLVTSAAIGLGALASCSSGNKTNEYPTYKEDIVMLNNTLDSLKQVKDEKKIGFISYYNKSKEAIENTEFNKAGKKPSAPGEWYKKSLLTIFIGLFGLAIGSNMKNRNNGLLLEVFSSGLSLTAILCTFVGGGIHENYESKQSSKVEEYKTQKIEKLNEERDKYLDEKLNAIPAAEKTEIMQLQKSQIE